MNSLSSIAMLMANRTDYWQSNPAEEMTPDHEFSWARFARLSRKDEKFGLSPRRELCCRNVCAKIVSLWIDEQIIRLNQDMQYLLSRYSR